MRRAMATPMHEPHDDPGDSERAAVARLHRAAADVEPPRLGGWWGVRTIRAKRAEATDWLERARERSTLIDVAMLIRERDREAAGTVAGSAVAFRLFLFFVPMLL